MMALRLLSVASALIYTALADIKFLTPIGGSSYSAGSTISITWEDSGIAPPLSSFTDYGINLCAGGNAPGSFVCTLDKLIVDGVYATTGNKASVIIPASTGGSMTNAYFIQIVSTSNLGVQVTNYSPRFSLTGMTGHFTAPIISGVQSVGTALTGPGTSAQQIPGFGSDTGSYGVPYDQQSGSIRYAPMQQVPGSTITAQSAAPLFPTSAVVIATTWLSRPFAQTTFTQSQTYSVLSRANTAAPAPLPAQDDMQRFLDRWKD